MNEAKKPRKPLMFYYGIVMLIIFLFNFFAVPWIAGQQVKEVDYGTFMSMIEEKNIGLVEISELENQIIFTDKEEKQIYKTAMVEDPTRTQRLYEAGAKFSGQFVEEPNWLLSILLTWVLPIVIFTALGRFLSRKMMDKAGGGPGAMSFNMGKSNAKIYVKSSDGINFSDVEGVDEAEESLAEIVDYLHDPSKYKEIGATMPKGVLLVGPPGTARPCLPRQLPVKQMYPSSLSPARSLWRCSWVWVPVR